MTGPWGIAEDKSTHKSSSLVTVGPQGHSVYALTRHYGINSMMQTLKTSSPSPDGADSVEAGTKRHVRCPSVRAQAQLGRTGPVLAAHGGCATRVIWWA
jgi:hypothetical protein